MLLFDLTACQPIGDTANHGGKEYAEAVFYEIMRRNYSVSGFYNSKIYVNEIFTDYCRNKGTLIDLNEISLQNALNSGNFSSFYSSLPYHYDNINWKDVKFIGNIHGLRDIEAFTDRYESLYAQTVYQKIVAIIKKCSLVKKLKTKADIHRLQSIINNPSFICLTGSEHSKYSIIMNIPDASESNIHVFCDPLIIEEVPENSFNEIGKYHLLVSGNRWVKNTLRGILALDELISAGQITNKVVVTGVSSNQRWLKKVKNKSYFIFRGYVSSKELASLFKYSYCLIFLSLSEGFGYPPLEAISRSVPVICSPLTAISEIYQNGVLYCNPYSIDDIKIKILELENELIRTQYVKQGEERFKIITKKQNEDMLKLVDFITSRC